jgi:hypothetical protein
MANSALPGFDAYGKATGKRGAIMTVAACAPLPDISREYGGAEICIDFNTKMREFLRESPALEVFLMARWTYYAEGYEDQRSWTPNQAEIVDRAGRVLPGTNFEIFAPAFETLLDEIGLRHKVTLINLWPVVPYSVPVAMLREAWFGTRFEPITLDNYMARNGRVVKYIAETGQARGMRVVSPHDEICGSGTCVMHRDGVPLYVDQTHLGPEGSKVLTEMLLRN